MTGRVPTIDVLLNLMPDAPNSVLSYLIAHPELASRQDGHGYSLLHAATSYEQLDLLRTLIQDFHVDPNIKDEDGETCLFNAESVEFAKELISLGIKVEVQNVDGQTAAEKLDNEDEQPQVAAYLRDLIRQNAEAASSPSVENTAFSSSASGANNTLANSDAEESHRPPPLPEGIEVSIGTMHADDVGEEPDPEFRRRIEELAARQDFEGEDGQRELRDLVLDAVSGLNREGQGPTTRRRLG